MTVLPASPEAEEEAWPRPDEYEQSGLERASMTPARRAVMIEATARPVSASRKGWLLLMLPVVFLLALVLAVQYLSPIERALADDASTQVRVIVYELAPQSDLRVPIEPGTEVLRIVAHLLRHGPVAPTAPTVRISARIRGDHGERDEDLVLVAPSDFGRVTPEDPGLTVGDPMAVNIDVHGVGVGELTLALHEAEGADGLLVRIYRREAKGSVHLIPNDAAGDTTRERLARRARELDWTDLPEDEQAAILAGRWKKVAALGDSGHTERAIKLSFAPRKARDAGPTAAPITTLDLRGDEKLAFIAHGPVHLSARAPFASDLGISATIREQGGDERASWRAGEWTFDVAPERTVSVELALDFAGTLALRASDPASVEPPSLARAWRVTPERPLVTTAGARALILRVSARRAFPRGSAGALDLALAATLSDGKHRALDTTRILTARVRPSTLDRYDGPSPEETPSDRATFHLLVPAGGTATLTPVGNPLDLSIAELDPLAVRPVAACPAPARLEGMIRCDEVRWDGFVPRRPSNALLFEPAGTRLLRVAHRLSPVKAPSPPAPKLLRFQRPATATSILRGGRIFAPAATPLELGFEGDRPVAVAVRLYSKEPVDVVARVDGDAPIRRALGAATRITTPRLIRVQGEVLAIVVLGDDLSRGRHVLTFEAPKGEKVWVHVPWTHRIIDPHWVEGDFEESQ